jgi:hypothetical protein
LVGVNVALIGNRSVLLKSPGRFLSGTVASIERSNYNKPGMMANRFQSMDRIAAAIPTGHLSPSAWSLPRTAGGMSSINSAVLDIESSATLYGGITADAITSFSITVADATGELISSGAGTAAFTFTVADALLAGTLAAGGSTSFTISTNAPLLGAETSVTGVVTFTFTASMTPFAIGNMIGTTDVTTELTAGQVATAVWESVIEAGYTAEEVLRLLSAYAAGDATGLNGTASFTGIDGVTTRIQGTVNGVTRTITGLDGS